MNIALLGYGKMGLEIEKIALQRHHDVVAIFDKHNIQTFDEVAPSRKIDVAIEFTTPQSAFEHVCKCLRLGLPVVCGTTGWQAQIPDAEKLCRQVGGSMLVSSNFSLGVKLFFLLNEYMAHITQNFAKEFASIGIEETHHTEKKDSPSGTAISTAQRILAERTDKQKWVQADSLHATIETEIPIVSKRIKDVAGIHDVVYQSPYEYIKLTHSAHNRSGFALGVVLGAEYIQHKKGIFEMKQVLGLRN